MKRILKILKHTPDTSGLDTTAALNEKASEIENKKPTIINLVSNSKINTTATEIENKTLSIIV